MQSTGLEKMIEHYGEAESREIYDLMLHTGRIIQVTSGGVRVFHKVTKFSAEEILKARRVFPRIDRNEKLDSLLNKLYNQPKDEEELRQKVINAVYRPIKKEIDEILIDNRNFLADHVAMAKVRTDLNSVIKSLDGLTLNMLNTVLNENKSTFKRNIELAVYSGLIASIIFGDFKQRRSNKRIVEDVILISIMYGMKDADAKTPYSSRADSKKPAKQYNLEFILDQAICADKSKTNIISEILFVAQKYTDILNLTNSEPINALISLQNDISENTAIAIGALFAKYSLRDYRIRYKKLSDEIKESLSTAESKLQAKIEGRISSDNPTIRKLGEFFVEDILIKRLFKTGFKRIVKFREFNTSISGIRQNLMNYLERLRLLSGEAYRLFEELTMKALDIIDTVEKELSKIVKSSEPAPLDDEIWSSISVGRKGEELDFLLSYASAGLIRLTDKFIQLYRMNQKLELHRNFSAINDSIRRLRTFMVKEGTASHDIARIIDIVSRSYKDGKNIRIIRAIPQDPITVTLNPYKFDQIISTILDNAVNAVQSRIRFQKGNMENAVVHYINTIVKREDGVCRIKIQDSGGGMDKGLYESIFVKRQPFDATKKGTHLLSVLAFLDEIEGSSIKVDTGARGTTIEMTLPVSSQSNEMPQTPQILSALKERHWNV